MKRHLLLSCAALSLTLGSAQAQDQSAELNTYFEEVFQAELKTSPETQSFLGIKDGYDQWDDPSDAQALRNFADSQKSVSDMQLRFGRAELDAQSRLSYRLFEYNGQRDGRAFPFRHNGYLFNQMFGAQSGLPAFLINIHRVSDASDAEAYIARLEGLKPKMEGLIAESERRAAMGVLPPTFVFDRVLLDAQNVLKGAPFEGDEPSTLLADFSKKVDALDLDDAEKSALKDRASTALLSSVKPAYETLIRVMESQKRRSTSDDGVWKFSDGAAFYAERLNYHTTTHMSADEIHALGLAEVARIHDEMRTIKDRVGFKGDLKAFMAHLRDSDEFYHENTDEGKELYLAEATKLIDTMKEQLPDYFATLPKADLVVKRVESFREKSAGKAFYQRPAPDGSRPGTYYANLYDTKDMPTYQMEALAYHEGIPGHHMQIAIQQELENIPKFRLFGGITAYSEGWGLYTEYLPKEMGFYTDPYSDFGRLAMELWRAARLVVDTGLHHKKWTREEAIQYLVDNTPNSEGDSIKAIERYIVYPGQATAYKIGMLKILEYRKWAAKELRSKFDIRGFHDVVLRNGPVPLAILEEQVKAWVASLK